MTYQFSQPSKINLDHGRPTPGPRRRLTGLTPTLLDAPRPSRADLKDIRNPYRLHPPIVSRKHPISKILRIGHTHPWLLPGPLNEPARRLETPRATRNPNKRRTRYDWIVFALGHSGDGFEAERQLSERLGRRRCGSRPSSRAVGRRVGRVGVEEQGEGGEIAEVDEAAAVQVRTETTGHGSRQIETIGE